MTSFRIGSLSLPMAPVGPPDPVPPVAGPPDPPFDLSHSPGLPADLVERSRYGHVRTVLPYLLQNDYGRSRQPGQLRVAVLENDTLRATFALDLGGRLWSLVHTPSGTELLHANPVLQPANLALRNAWFAGGVEWNIGTRGHSPTTCEPLHAALVQGPAGDPVLRMWEWERLRGVVFQIDAWLPADSAVLLVHVRIRNPNRGVTPMYWWSNAAVVETDGLRVLAPTGRAFRTSYAQGRLVPVPFPEVDGGDASYPARAPIAADYFYDIPGATRPWIVALDQAGRGLAQQSTARLRGRKLFCWGTTVGGRHWQDWLTPGGPRYAEIQAGLAPTQYEHLPMPAGATWSWTEAYGRIETDPAVSHAPDWSAATGHVSELLDRLHPRVSLGQRHAEAERLADLWPTEIVGRGSGWGALERRRRALAGEPPMDGPATPFGDDTCGPDQAPWLSLLDRGELPQPDPAVPPPSYVTGADWPDRLRNAPQHWATAYHLAVIAHAGGDLAAARAAYQRSLSMTVNAWAERGLAQVAQADADFGLAADLARRAHARRPDVRSLAIEAVQAAIAAGDATAALALVDRLPAQVRRHGRIRLAEATAAISAGEPERARQILDQLEIPDLREGETSPSKLWTTAFPGRPLPARHDFRMQE